MSHLLKSINPDAALNIQPDPPKARKPGVGDIVVYNMRRGHARQGRTRFPAIVQEAPPNAGVVRGIALTVIMEAGELINQTLVEQAGVGGDEGHTWEWPEMGFAAEAIRNMATSAHTRIGDLEAYAKGLEAKIAGLEKVVLGDFNAPRISIIDIMQDFENRLRDIATQAGAEVAKGKGKRK